MGTKTNSYAFAIGKQIKQVFTESYLYLDGLNNAEVYEDTSIRRMDKPLFLLLENDSLVTLHGPSLYVTDDFYKKYVLGKDFHSEASTQRAFQFLCGTTILDIQEYKVYYDYEDKEYNVNEFAEPINPDDISDLAIVLDNGMRLVCNMFFDYFDIRILE